MPSTGTSPEIKYTSAAAQNLFRVSISEPSRPQSTYHTTAPAPAEPRRNSAGEVLPEICLKWGQKTHRWLARNQIVRTRLHRRAGRAYAVPGHQSCSPLANGASEERGAEDQGRILRPDRGDDFEFKGWFYQIDRARIKIGRKWIDLGVLDEGFVRVMVREIRRPSTAAQDEGVVLICRLLVLLSFLPAVEHFQF